MKVVQRGVERVPDVEVFTLLAEIRWTEPHRKKRSGERLDHRRDHIARRQLALAAFVGPLLRVAPCVPDPVQCRHDIVCLEPCHRVLSSLASKA